MKWFGNEQMNIWLGRIFLQFLQMSNNNVPRWTPNQYKGPSESYQPSSSNQHQNTSSYVQNYQHQPPSQYQQFQTDFSSRDRNRAMFHSTIAPTVSNSTFSLSSYGRNVNEPSSYESKNQSLHSQGQEGHEPTLNNIARQIPSFVKDTKAGQVNNKNDNNFDRFGFKSEDKNTQKDFQGQKVIGGAQISGNQGETAAEKRKRQIMQIKSKLDEINKKMGKRDLNINPSADIKSFGDKPRPKIAQSCIFETQKPIESNNTGGISMLEQLYSQKKSNALAPSGNIPKTNNDQLNFFKKVATGGQTETKQDLPKTNYAFQNITSIPSEKNIKEQIVEEPKKSFIPSKNTSANKEEILSGAQKKSDPLQEKKPLFKPQQKVQPQSYTSKPYQSGSYASNINSASNPKTYGTNLTTNYGSTTANTYSSGNTSSSGNPAVNSYNTNTTTTHNYLATNTTSYGDMKKQTYAPSYNAYGNTTSSNPSSNSTNSGKTSYEATYTTGVTSSNNQGSGPSFSKKKNTFQVSESIKIQTKPVQQAGFKKNKVAELEVSSLKKTFSNEQTVQNKTVLKEFKKEDFHIGKKMGKGQFGQVLLVRHKLTGFVCGMKVMEKKQIRQENYVGQIARELSIQFYLEHRNVAPLYGYFSDKENVYLLVEFCTDGQLLQRLRTERRMQENDVAIIMKQVCQGLDYIHREQILHRDIKPQNILFNHGVVKISDFGWAVYRGFGMRKTASGSPLYYPPEIVKGEEYDDKIDIWTIGMMTYECILGKIPFRIYTEMDLDRIVSDEITFPQWVDVTDTAKDFILKTMCKKGEERMEIKQILRHPFISKAVDVHLDPKILEDFRKVLNN